MMFIRILTAALLCLVASTCSAATVDHDVAGIWFGETMNGKPVNTLRCTVLLITEEQFSVIHGRGVSNSKLKFAKHEKYRSLELDRYDGEKQNGVYKVKNGKLIVTLADPGEGRLTGDTVEDAKGAPHEHYEFTRVPTREGLELLQSQLEANAIQSLIAPAQ